MSPDRPVAQETERPLGGEPGSVAASSDPEFVAGPARAADARGFIRRTAWSAEPAERDPTAGKVARMFAAEFGAPMTENSARAFTAVTTLAVAVGEARSTDPERIRSALRTVGLPGRDLVTGSWDHVRSDAGGPRPGGRRSGAGAAGFQRRSSREVTRRRPLWIHTSEYSTGRSSAR
ncbi:hypothetical protein [Streptomyces sp. YIM B13518]|uniref:hypothetical protein n=1 Tax=Streptomyces sp. YIM B13518 TaxID=3366316 RepID=UPI0036A434CE